MKMMQNIQKSKSALMITKGKFGIIVTCRKITISCTVEKSLQHKVTECLVKYNFRNEKNYIIFFLKKKFNVKNITIVRTN